MAAVTRITGRDIRDGTITDTQISPSAGIAWSKIDAWSKQPKSSPSPGAAGDIACDSSYLYVCVSKDTWKRVALSSW